ARGGVARDAMLAALDGWTADLGDAPEVADARLVLLRHAAAIADPRRAGPIAGQITKTRLVVAKHLADGAPLDALAILVEEPHLEAMAVAATILTRLVESPSMLAEAGPDLDKWLAATSQTDALHVRVVAQRELAVTARAEAEAEDVTTAQLTAMLKKRPWDQRVVLRLANDEASAGKLAPAAARLRALGSPALMIREARLLLAQLASAEGKLEEADALLDGLLGARLSRFAAASAAYQDAVKAVQTQLEQRLKIGDLPYDVLESLQRGTEDEQRAIVHKWINDQIDADPAVQTRQGPYLALGDVVSVSLVAGSVKLRRAQAMSGAAQSAMLEAAERTFLAIRIEAEGQPEFRLGLGEIYARLGRSEESTAEFDALLAMKDPAMSLRVAEVYRSIGSVQRAKEIATEVHATATEPKARQDAASMLGLLARNDEEAETWYRKADGSSQYVKLALLELEARKLYRQGKPAECDAKFALVAKTYLAAASSMSLSDFNNAAVAHQQRFYCSGDLRALADAEAAFDRAYRARSDNPIVVGNLGGVLGVNGKLRVLGKRIDISALRLSPAQADSLIEALLDSSERDAVLAELAAEPKLRRSADLYGQYEVLAPNNPGAYRQRFDEALLKRDEAGAAAVLARAKQAKALDLSEVAEARKRWESGEGDAEYHESVTASLARLERAIAQPKVSAKTRAAGRYLQAIALRDLAVSKGDVPMLAQARTAALEAMQLWPALQLNGTISHTYVDEAGFAADATTWAKLRRTRNAIAALDKLVTDGSPLAAKLRGSQQWTQLVPYARADTTRPTTADHRLARLLGDAVLETRSKAFRDDRLQHLEAELDVLLDPTSESKADELAYFGRE
ncbi:MAG: hypothetical protein M3680_35145, partial [Myxococcota bacterium]|nr:hypothetical protein [Myxococcota bacterium]